MFPGSNHNTKNPFDYTVQDRERRRQRTRTYLLYESFREISRTGRLHLAYRVGDAFFYQVNGRQSMLPAEVDILKKTMERKIAERRPLAPLSLDRDAALKRFDDEGKLVTAAWVRDMENGLPVFYLCCDGLLAFKGPLAEHTGDVGRWDLVPYPPGILMRVAPPQREDLPDYHELPKLFRTFFEAKQWGLIHGASFISDVNRTLRENRMDRFIQVAEALQSRRIARIADDIASMQPVPKVVLVSGPSGSGKSSFARLLEIHLRVNGLDPLPLSLDNYYKPRNQVPRDDTGDYDFEALEAIDLRQFNEDIMLLVAGEEVSLPLLDFRTHHRIPGPPVKLKYDSILIVEGIHGLNPALTPHLTAPSVYRIFVSALNHLNLDDLSRVSTTDLRMLRRIVRDRQARGYPAAETMKRWTSVRVGEQKWIFPFQEEADTMFNSALPYELNALKPKAVEALAEVKEERFKPEVSRLLRLLDAVHGLPVEWTAKFVPTNSIFREFFGGSVLIRDD